jgi:small subunit ribosomal protein S4
MRYTGSRNKVARREGTDLNLKTPGSKAHANLLRKLTIIPGQHGVTKRRKKQTERGKQLREKQKLRYTFGVTDTQLKMLFAKAKAQKGNTSVILGQLLEQRLDNVVFRMGFAPTRAGARQLVNHKHILVDGVLNSVASHQVKKGQTISFKNEKSAKIPYIEASLTNKNVIMAPWVQREGLVGKVVETPDSTDIEKQVNMQSVIEYYSR